MAALAVRHQRRTGVKSVETSFDRPFVISFATLCSGSVLYLFGLIAPLTPSEGLPSQLELCVFAGIPIWLCASSALLFSSWSVRIPMLTPAAAMFAFTVLLLARMSTGLP